MRQQRTVNFKHLFLSNIVTLVILASAFFAYQVIAVPNSEEKALSDSIDVLSYQGSLVDSNGDSISGIYDMTFRLYSDIDGTNQRWIETHEGENEVIVDSGLFDVTLGRLNPIPATVWNEPELYLGIQIGEDDEMRPLEEINLLPPQIATGSLDASVLKPNTMSGDPFPTYYFGMSLDYVLFVNNHITGEYSDIEVSSCPVDGTWCCNAEDTICVNRSSSGEDQLAIRMEETHSVACWLVHQEDDKPYRSSGISYSTDIGNESPFVNPGGVFYLSRAGTGDYPIATNSGYQVVCFN